MPRSSFQRQLERSRDTAEKPIAEWLKEQGKYIVPQYAFSGPKGEHAPGLEGPNGAHITAPDLLVCDLEDGRTFGLEVKLKTRADYTRATNEEETGLDERLWDEYELWSKAIRMPMETSSVHDELDPMPWELLWCFASREERLEMIATGDGLPGDVWGAALVACFTLGRLLEGDELDAVGQKGFVARVKGGIHDGHALHQCRIAITGLERANDLEAQVNRTFERLQVEKASLARAHRVVDAILKSLIEVQ